MKRLLTTFAMATTLIAPQAYCSVMGQMIKGLATGIEGIDSKVTKELTDLQLATKKIVGNSFQPESFSNGQVISALQSLNIPIKKDRELREKVIKTLFTDNNKASESEIEEATNSYMRLAHVYGKNSNIASSLECYAGPGDQLFKFNFTADMAPEVSKAQEAFKSAVTGMSPARAIKEVQRWAKHAGFTADMSNLSEEEAIDALQSVGIFLQLRGRNSDIDQFIAAVKAVDETGEVDSKGKPIGDLFETGYYRLPMEGLKSDDFASWVPLLKEMAELKKKGEVSNSHDALMAVVQKRVDMAPEEEKPMLQESARKLDEMGCFSRNPAKNISAI